MRAIVVSTPGDSSALEYTEVPDPVPGPGEVLIDVAASGVNFIDVYHRMGRYPLPLPFMPGSEGAGTVAAVGAGRHRGRRRRQGGLGERAGQLRRARRDPRPTG